MTNVVISVIMAVYNGEKYLKEAIDSVLNQTFNQFEFIIINDGSTDTSRDIIESYADPRIRLINQENAGLAISLNRGIQIGRGRYIARMDADDICVPFRFANQLQFLELHPDYVLVGANAVNIDQDGKILYNSDLPLSWEGIKSYFPLPPIYHSSVMFRRDSAIKAGLYYEAISKICSFEDNIFWNKLVKYGKFANIEDPLIWYRLVPSSASYKSGPQAKIIKRILLSIVEKGFIRQSEINELLELKQVLTFKEREFFYNFHIGKRLLFTSFQPQKSRKYLRKAIEIKPLNIYIISLFFLSIFPRFLVKYIYSLAKPPRY